MDERTNGIHPLRVRIPAFQPRNNNNDDEDSNNNNTDKADEDINNGNNNNSRNNEKFFAMWRQLENFTDIFFNHQKKIRDTKNWWRTFQSCDDSCRHSILQWGLFDKAQYLRNESWTRLETLCKFTENITFIYILIPLLMVASIGRDD